jgi:hypothetical protein
MSWRLACAFILTACNPPITDRQFCVKQQMAWEMAFPALSQTDAQRKQTIEDCVAAMPAKHASGEFDRSLKCFDDNVHGHGHAHEQYVAFKQCEQAAAPGR